ncbi:hypothetical protein NPIL_94311 [Nephila pilipes]|uniref:Uncharacterized protein n=1 Tax=Nephila pilipes TaxID=299642 RepID=A0A8X6UP25_NEPPI|nr:hypothetical protein NPIL_94311 [Nephila pilipes]
MCCGEVIFWKAIGVTLWRNVKTKQNCPDPMERSEFSRYRIKRPTGRSGTSFPRWRLDILIISIRNSRSRKEILFDGGEKMGFLKDLFIWNIMSGSVSLFVNLNEVVPNHISGNVTSSVDYAFNYYVEEKLNASETEKKKNTF